jgi:hypothetical protein
MNKISPLDIRIAVLAYPLVAKEDQTFSSPFQKPAIPYAGDERIISLFQNSPKAQIDPTRSRIPPILRKGQFVILRLFEILKTLLTQKEKSTILEEINPPRQLFVPKLPHPPFKATKPPRFFWHPAYQTPKDEYAPGCLISESKEKAPAVLYNSASICAYARHIFPKNGTLRQDPEGFVYLELPDHFITEIYPLLYDQECEAIPLHDLEPSPAHIPVILSHEWAQKKGWGEISALETHFSFEITRLCSLKPKRWPGIAQVYFLEIKSQELENFRERHLLPSRIRGHHFHVAIAFKKAEEKPADAPKETFRLNVSCFAA